jgi:DNA-binding transcriptional LysR family regulator
MLDFRVQTFLAVCRTLNYTKAAEILHITQPAVSQHIHFLEQHYGVKLFHYEKKKLTLTPQGKILKNRLLVLQNDERRVNKELQSVFSGKLSISIGVTMTVGEYAIADPLSALLKNHPDWSIHVIFGNTQKLLGLLEAGTIDFALVEGYYSQMITSIERSAASPLWRSARPGTALPSAMWRRLAICRRSASSCASRARVRGRYWSAISR